MESFNYHLLQNLSHSGVKRKALGDFSAPTDKETELVELSHGGGGGLVVSVLNFYSDNTSSIPMNSTAFFL